MSDFAVHPYATAIGAEVTGVDLSRALDDSTWTALRDAYLEHLVLFFHDQKLTPAQQVEFSRRFGRLEEYPFVHGIDGYPELIEIVKEPDEVINFGHLWHTDMTFREQPPAGAVLYALEVPPVGGDTLFANMYLAWEMLSEGMKAVLRQLRAIHDSGTPQRHTDTFKGMKMQHRLGSERQITAHPFVWVHPETGRESLLISPSYCHRIEGMTDEESRMILDHLERHATQDILTCRFRWQPGTVVIWDNRCTMHIALEDDLAAMRGDKGFRRVMRRATIGV